MKRIYHFAMLMSAVVFLLGTTSCQKDDATLSSNIIGNWKYEEGQTTYSAGLLLNLTGQSGALDTATVISTVSTLFSNSEMTFSTDNTGTIKKDVAGSATTGSSVLTDIISSITNSLINVDYTYAVSSGNVILTINKQQYKLKVLSITDTQMQVAMEVTDLSNWTTAILGNSVTNLTQSAAYNSISTLAASFGIFANPTIKMTFTKK